MDRDGFEKLYDLARADVPVLQVCGTIDPILGKNASAIEAIYQEFGGRISMMIKEGYAHHPHSLRNPKPIADFMEQSVQAVRGPAPAFVGDRFTRTSYYSIESFYRDYPDAKTPTSPVAGLCFRPATTQATTSACPAHRCPPR